MKSGPLRMGVLISVARGASAVVVGTQNACSCEGFRTPGHRDEAAHMTGADVGKPPGKEAARWLEVGPRVLWGFVGSAGGVGDDL